MDLVNLRDGGLFYSKDSARWGASLAKLCDSRLLYSKGAERRRVGLVNQALSQPVSLGLSKHIYIYIHIYMCMFIYSMYILNEYISKQSETCLSHMKNIYIYI